jgi:hypothetical protein
MTAPKGGHSVRRLTCDYGVHVTVAAVAAGGVASFDEMVTVPVVADSGLTPKMNVADALGATVTGNAGDPARTWKPVRLLVTALITKGEVPEFVTT